MKMRNAGNKILLSLFVAALLLAGCKSKKSVVEVSRADIESMALVSAAPAVASPCTALSGNLKLSVDVNGKPFSAKGTMRIKEGDGVQIGVTALGLVEIACLEFFPENARLIYKLGKEYTDVSYAEVAFLQKSGINYEMLESVLLNRIFSPDGRPALQALPDMAFADEGDCVTATTRPSKGIVYKFSIDKLTGNLVRSEGQHEGGGHVVCDYSGFEDIDGVMFPHTISLALGGVGTDVALSFVLSRVEIGNIVFTPRRISSSYDKLAPEQLLKSVIKK
ncbi:MAG: DUF4292 domain-containing protein [Bacteroidaceae bacterium]|nr:DUF4292 domain-containing protein [Bacteroidaceae bacterium]